MNDLTYLMGGENTFINKTYGLFLKMAFTYAMKYVTGEHLQCSRKLLHEICINNNVDLLFTDICYVKYFTTHV